MGDKKRYKLLKDYERPTHVIRAGTEGGDNHWKNVFPELLGIDLLTLPDWFQLIEDEEKIELISDVTVDHTNTHRNGIDVWYGFCTNKRISDKKCFDIKQAIGQVLNNEPKEAFVNLNVKHGSKSFTEEDMRYARMEAFGAARQYTISHGHPLKYPTFGDYLNFLNQPSKP